MLKKTYKNKNKLLSTSINILTFMLIMGFFVAISEDLIAAARNQTNNKPRPRKKVRVYNPPQTKANAVAMLQTSSELSELAKIEPTTSTNSESKAHQKVEQPVQNGDSMLSDVELLKTFLSVDEMMEIECGDEGEDIAELEAEDDIKVNIDDFRSLWLLAIGGNESNSKTSYGVNKEELMAVIMDWLGTPYKFGGATKKAIDCSAWTRAVFLQAGSMMLPRTAREQINVGRNVARSNLEFGDMVFFHTYTRRFASHVGIYLGDNLFVHASSREGVTVSSLNSTYYSSRFIGGRRFSERDLHVYKASNK